MFKMCHGESHIEDVASKAPKLFSSKCGPGPCDALPLEGCAVGAGEVIPSVASGKMQNCLQWVLLGMLCEEDSGQQIMWR